MPDLSVKLIVNSHPVLFENEVNSFLDSLNSKENIQWKKVEYSVCPWQIDGQAGCDFSAFISYSL